MPEGDDLAAGVTWPAGSMDHGVDGGGIGFGASRDKLGKLTTAEKDHSRGEATMPAYPVLQLGRIDFHHVSGCGRADRLPERRRLPCRMKAEHSPRRRTNLLTRQEANCQSAG